MDKQNIDLFIAELKEKGFTQIESVKLLIDKFHLSLSEADSYLVQSKSWESKKKETIEIRNLFFEDQDDLPQV